MEGVDNMKTILMTCTNDTDLLNWLSSKTGLIWYMKNHQEDPADVSYFARSDFLLNLFLVSAHLKGYFLQ